MPDSTDIDALVALEAAQLAAMPRVPISNFQPKGSGSQGRCGWCGQWSDNLVEVETGRFKGINCCGGRNA